jgi:hypothetical protein
LEVSFFVIEFLSEISELQLKKERLIKKVNSNRVFEFLNTIINIL